ncbi:unnamed protein product [Clonostachys rosea]|uniref:Uncharacterized protein n=1 Tax=Bionectria ochroleuca TaxID=29856 RepID=A0ABY6V0C7_BIOOC|nr:unnamed protein product [Clonostachys rosea]
MKDQDFVERVVPYTDEDPFDGDTESDHAAPDDALVNEDRELEIIDVPVPRRRSKLFSRCSKCLLAVIALLGLLLVALLLVSRWASTRHATTPGGHQGGHSKKPSKKPSKPKAIPYKLDFPGLYPQINAGASQECQAAWGELTMVPCHDKVFDRGNDNGTLRLFGWDPMYFLPKICTEECRNALQKANENVAARCSPTDTFLIDGYQGMFNTDFLEAGPVGAVETLLRRMDHQCRKSPTGDSDYEYCPTEMLERFSIIDGLNANLVGIESFIHETDRKRVEPGHWKKGKKGTSKYSYKYNYKVREQRYGPGAGDTSCGWCTFDYLNRTLTSWAEGKVSNPSNDQPVSLPEFIRRVRTAGERCAPTARWEKMYAEGLEHYQALGVLQPDWETALPSGDLDYLILHGPSSGDAPISTINAEVERLKSLDEQQAWPIKTSQVCLKGLAERYTSAKCYINLSHEKLVSMMENDSKKLRKAFCDSDCSDAINAKKVSTCDAAAATDKTRELLDDFNAAKAQRTSFCGVAGKDWQHSDCAQALLNMDRATWAFEGRPDSPTLVKDVGQALDQLTDKLVPEDLRSVFLDNPDVLSKNRKESFKRVTQVRESVCAACVWNWLAGIDLNDRMDYISTSGSASEYVDFVKKYHKTCSALGADWLGDLPYGNDPAIWRMQQQDGRVFRYIEVKNRHGRQIVYAVNEATGSVHYYEDAHRLNRPGVDVATLWHVLEAERGVKAMSEGKFEDWKSVEEKHRKEEDEKIWKVDTRWSLQVSYIGPVPLEY